jgi:hypothetical protein
MNGIIRCAQCGKIHFIGGEGTMEFIDGHFYCEDCVSEVSFICERCGERHLLAYASVVDGMLWCEDCVQQHSEICTYCEERHALSDMTYVDSEDGYVCSECLTWHFETCSSCGRAFRTDDMYDDEDGQYYCDDCMDRRTVPYSDNARVRSYHDAPPLRWFGDCLPSWNGVMRGIGIELEVDGGEHDENSKQRALNRIDEIAGEHLHFEYDGSLDDGFEIVTQPHTVRAFYQIPWEEILKICDEEGFSSHDCGTCGLHVHFSREMFGADEETQQDNIAKLMQFYELYWDDVLKVSRRTEEQANSWASRYATANKKNLKDFAKGERYAGRYMAINLTNDHTVEIRLTRGTLNYDTFMASIDFMVTAVLNSCRIGWSDTTDDYEWISGMDLKTLNYLKSRFAFVDAIRRIENI